MPDRRAVLAGLSALAGCAALPKRNDAVVGKGGFSSIAEAVAAAPGDRPFRILIRAGVWRERVVIDKPFVELIGAGRDATTIVFNKSAGDLGEDGKPIGTFGTATVKVRAPDFTARDLTIANDFDYPAHLPGPSPTDKTGASGSQAVALAVEGDADRTLLQNVRLTGWQDTLYVNGGRSLFRGCRVEGCVDFIFGAGRALFESCEIVSRIRAGQAFNGYIAAPSTNVHQPLGLVFVHCRLEKEPGMAAHSVALGRPWRRTGSFADGKYGDPGAVGAAAFIDCWMDDHILTEAWQPMGYTAKDGTKTMLQPEAARLYEFGSTGPGAGAASERRRILTADQARAFSQAAVLEGWSP